MPREVPTPVRITGHTTGPTNPRCPEDDRPQQQESPALTASVPLFVTGLRVAKPPGRMGTFDRARSHQGIPVDRAGTHIAMFVAWLIERDLLADDHLGEPTTAWYIGRIRSRERTARDLVADLFNDQLT